jgi:hypothetical protein
MSSTSVVKQKLDLEEERKILVVLLCSIILGYLTPQPQLHRQPKLGTTKSKYMSEKIKIWKQHIRSTSIHNRKR